MHKKNLVDFSPQGFIYTKNNEGLPWQTFFN
jgi:hypothetical protein